MTQSQAVIETIDKLGGIATLNQINCHVFEVEDCVWKTKNPFVSVRRIVQQTKGIYKIRHFCYMYLLFFCLILLYVVIHYLSLFNHNFLNAAVCHLDDVQTLAQ